MRSKIQEIEKKHGKTIKEVLPTLMDQHGSVSAVASALGVTQGTVSLWIKHNGLKVKTILVSDKDGVA
jgi:predicted transcriptional regulator